MDKRQYFKSKIFKIAEPAAFESLALEMFHYQFEHNTLYRNFCQALGKEAHAVQLTADIPHLPISFFKTQRVSCASATVEKIFSSSGTGGTASKHLVADLDLYEKSFNSGWQHFYPLIEDFCVLALLPSYLERSGSSLIYMAEHFIQSSSDSDSGFYLHDLKALHQKLKEKIKAGQPTLLLGVTFALLDLAELAQLPPNDILVMETGGMKGRRKEMIRSEVHQILKERLGVSRVHSEYGMTELLSQAYSQGGGYFRCPPWMQVSVRETDDPLSVARMGKTGGLNVIDLANMDSCPFIATEDLARLHPDASFEVMGRFDNSDIRGCNLMVV